MQSSALFHVSASALERLLSGTTHEQLARRLFDQEDITFTEACGLILIDAAHKK